MIDQLAAVRTAPTRGAVRLAVGTEPVTVELDGVLYDEGGNPKSNQLVNAEVTVLAYHFWTREGYGAAFAHVQHAIEETWRHCGALKTVLVVNERQPCVDTFAASHPNVEVQEEPSLVPGDIHTMSVDCNSRLYTRFKTPYVLIVQNDGYPLRDGLRDFVGRYDFIGAPYVRDVWWKRLVCRLFSCWTQNGGFSLRSRRICEAAAKLWNEKYSKMGKCANSSEDIFYTQFLPLHDRAYRRTFRLATNRESLRFSWDAIVPIPQPKDLPFGAHGEKSLAALPGNSLADGLQALAKEEK